MADSKTLLMFAAHSRRMAGRCANAAVARRFEALARDYEAHARRVADAPPADALQETVEERGELRAAS